MMLSVQQIRGEMCENLDLLQTEFRYDFQKGPHQVLAGGVFMVFRAKVQINTVITVPAKI